VIRHSYGNSSWRENIMRTPIESQDGFKARAIAGTRAIIIALDCEEEARAGLLGFAFRRTVGGQSVWLLSHKVFKSVEPNPDPRHGLYPTNRYPVQSFLWSDFTAEPGTRYTFEVHPVYGTPAHPKLRDPLVLKVLTEEEEGKQHSIWFNRGAIASQAYAKQFDNHKPTDEEMNDPDNKHTRWLSRGLLEACLEYIRSTQKTEKLRGCFYEFTYRPILEAFAKLIDDGFDVELIVHDDRKGKNKAAMRSAGLPVNKSGEIVHWRTRTKIPHNKFIIRFKGDKPTEVWTGSTNITASGFLGQSNVGHIVHDETVAGQYFEYWKILQENPTGKPTKAAVVALSPYPPALPKKKSMTCIFSPRQAATMLNWYADRMDDATSCIMFTAAFTVASDFVGPLSKPRNFLRFVLKEKPPTREERTARVDRNLVIAYGGVLGAQHLVKNGKLVVKRKVSGFSLDRWFVKEELTRSEGNIFFVHTKYLLIDPLSDDPLICTGSANFSENSLTGNDENMVLIRGNTRVADIYLTEFDRLFRHFYFRDVSNELTIKRQKGQEPEKVWLDERFIWTDEYFWPGGFKTRRREMFFHLPPSNWAAEAAKHSNQEPVRPKKVKKRKAKKRSRK
jgi:phosphatidylserine/phosphatidylglycerophosphate/cardiolipin synthase-like enzyme